MTPQIAMVLAVLVLAMTLFISERLRTDMVALLVLVSLAALGLVAPSDAVAGFGNPAVITVAAVFILSGSLTRTGVASVIGRQILRLAGGGEARLIAVIMISAGLMSAVMNNVGVAALLLPVVVDLARHTGRAPSRLLMPLSYATLLGGLITLIGTPPNLLVSEALHEAGFRPFQIFDFTPMGLTVLLSGVAFMVLVGRRFLPIRDVTREAAAPRRPDLRQLYDLRERLFTVHLPDDSPLDGKTLAQSRVGSALGLNVIAILRGDQTLLAPSTEATLRAGDRLLVQGRADRLAQVNGRHHLAAEEASGSSQKLVSSDIGVAEVQLAPGSPLLGKTLCELNFRHRFGVNVLVIWRGGVPRRTHLQDMPLQLGDALVVQGPLAKLEQLQDALEFTAFRPISEADVVEVYRVHERLVVLRVPDDSIVAGNTLAESRLGDAFGLTVLGITRGDVTQLMPGPDERLEAGDTLLVEARPEDLLALRGLQGLEMEGQAPLDLRDLESDQVGLAEVVLSPHTTLVGRTLRDLHFREKYGLSVLAIWREGRAYRSNLRDMTLRFGDALLLYGPRERLRVLGQEPDFLVLTEEAQEAPRLDKAPRALAIMLAVLAPVFLGWVPISIAALAGAAMMVLSGCITMDEAYRFVEWRAIVLIAGMLPLGVAMTQTGTASFLGEVTAGLVGPLGPLAVVAGLFLMTSLMAQVMPTHAVAVLMTPIALNMASSQALSPYALGMVVAVAASASFLSPVGHPANLLVMGPGGYRFSDYTRVGLPLTLVVLVVTVLALPIFWPLQP
ncbi:MAG: SLC13 family permease [Chloroflexi bacterium]|nr:SLC13 family permease [Chloroflexota bacterium]